MCIVHGTYPLYDMIEAKQIATWYNYILTADCSSSVMILCMAMHKIIKEKDSISPQLLFVGVLCQSITGNL